MYAALFRYSADTDLSCIVRRYVPADGTMIPLSHQNDTSIWAFWLHLCVYVCVYVIVIYSELKRFSLHTTHLRVEEAGSVGMATDSRTNLLIVTD